MSVNMGELDRMLRAGAGVVLLLLAYFQGLSGWTGWALAAVGVVLLATAVMRYCPAYTLFGRNTCSVKRP